MKLHLPVSLRKCLLSVLSAVSVTCGTAMAGVMHTDATFATYSDFGQNKGRYVMGNAVNSLLQYIRDTEGGIGIEYTDGTQTYYLSNEQGMIDFIGVHDAGHSGLVSPNMLATVLHNGSLNGSFSGNDIGETYAQNYSVIDIRGSNKFRVMEENGDDYMMQRQSRVVTDAIAAPISTIDVSTVTGQHMYHSGAGIMGLYDENIDTFKSLAWAYVFNIGDIDMLTGVSIRGDKGQFGIYKEVGYGNGIGASLENPLPNATRGGDSGSPVFIYNTETGQYEYLASHQSGNGRSWGQARGNLVWAHKTVKSYDVAVDMANTNEVHIGAVTAQGETISDNIGNSTTIWSGTVTAGDKTVSFNGVKEGQYTWRDMSDIKDSQTWYAYDADLYNASTNADGKLNLSDADLFYTENLVFTAGQSDNRIVLDATVDMGAGYTEFNKGSQEHAEFTIIGDGKQLHTAGYVVNDGTEVHLKLTNPSDYMTEWRKIGAGDLYIDGQGDTNALLNVGGSGSTYLQQEGGYAAYNVLVNTGATVVIQDTKQIERDLTFGAGGGVLDMNGNSMNWYTSNGSTPRSGSFTINALTDEAMITNSSATAVTLTYKESGDTAYKGSFRDTSTGALSIDYQGGGTWTLHSIHTDLTNHAGSGLSVTNGKVVLEGTNTIHGTGSATATNQVRYENTMDWHYADASMSVTVKDGAVFELGSHARLTGDVNVKQGGTFVMREGVQHAQEYIEGGTKLQNTADFADFYGLKGGVALDAGADMLVQYSEGTTAATTYGGNISGSGNVTIDLGSDEMSLILSGTNTFTGTKTITSGGLVARNLAALGNTSSNKWLVEKNGWIASRGFKEGVDILSYIDKNSTGTLALSHNLSSQLNLANHQGLFLGAESGKTVHYGEEGTKQSLSAQNGAWRLGGGGGELVVNFLLEGANNLLLGAGESSTGSVYLANSGNSFSGTVDFNASGMKLGYAAGALGSSVVNLSYGNGLVLNQAADVARVAADAEGMLLLDKLGADALDLSRFSSVALGASEDTTFSGSITCGADGVYRFSSMNGATLRVTSALNAAGNIVVDAQNTDGGTVVLAGNKYFEGEIQVLGSKDASQGGNITLAAGQSMSLFGNISLGAGTSLDVAGNSVYLYQGISGDGQVVDSRSSGTLYLAARNGELNHSLALNLATVRKTGGYALNLSGSHGFGALYVDAGSLVLANNFSTSLNSSIYQANGTSLNLQSASVETNIGMQDNAGTATLAIADNGNATLRGDIHLGSGSQLNMQATGGTIKLAGGSYGGENATLSVRAKELHFATGSGVDMLGTLSLENDMKLYSNGEATDMERNISNMQVNNNARITLDERTWSTVWNIDSLNGSGEILWNSNTTHETTSRLILRGEGNFSGSISLDRKYEKEERTHGAFIELAHDKAAQNASISLSGKSANAVASLAVNTKNAQIKGLSGNEHSYVYAGSAMSGAELMGDARPSTNRTATLTVNVDSGKEFTYAGTVGNSTDTISNGLSLNKTGAGTQKFTGATYVNNITVQQGTLSLNAENLSVRGNVGVATGATLNMGDYTLASGKTFSVLGGGSGSANFGGTLTLAGGSLSFSGIAMTSGGAALNLGGLNTGSVSSQTVHFTDTSSLKKGQTYTLASGDWTSIYQNMSATGLHYYDATFGVNNAGNLQVSLALKSNSLVWDGSGSFSTEWSNSKFGDSYASFNSNTTVVFDDSARSSYVGVFYCSQNVAAAVFNTTGSYTVVSYDGNQTHATARDLVVQGGGSVSINGGLRITNSTTIEEGELILGQHCDGNTLKGTVTGAGTLVIDGASNVNPVLRDLGALRIKSGSYSSASGALDVDNIIVDSAGTYIHWHNYEGNITSNGGTLELYSGSISGVLELNGDTRLVSLVTNTNDTFKLNATIVDNGYTITQTGNGLVDITPASQSILNNYVVKQGKLMFTGGSHSGHGKLTATESGTLLIGSRANLSATNVHLSNGGTLDMQAQSTLMTDMTTSGAVAVKLGNETTYLKGSVTGSGTLAVSGQGVVQSLLADSAEGALALEVSGTALSLLAANTYSGGTTLNSGSLYARNSHALGTGAVTVNGGTLWLDISGLGALGSVSSVTLNSGSVLDISAATFSADTGLMLGGSLTVNSGAYINLGTLSTDNVKYTIFDLTSAGASAADWMSMQDRIMVNGSMLSTLSDWTLGLTDYGATLTFGTVLPDPLVWIGGESGIWNQTENSWDNTPKVPDDSLAFTNGDSVEFTTSATVQVADSVEAQNMSIGSGVDLALSGDLTVTGAIIAEGDAFATSGNLTAEKITIASGSFETVAGKKLTAGTVNQKGGSLVIKGDADIGQLDVAAGLTTHLYNETASSGTQKEIDKLVLGKGATLEVYDKESGASATTLGTLLLNGETATVQDLYNSSHVVVESLNMNATLESATLSLVKNASSDKVSRFEFGSDTAAAGNFKGRVELSVGNTRTNLPAAIIISGKDALAGAVVDLKSANSYIGLGINADNTTIAGLESGESVGSNAKLFSGTIGANAKWDAQNTPATISTTERTLNINTAAGSTHTFHGEVLSKLNLVKQGDGTQVFNGTSNSFDGSLTVQGGTLKLGENALGMLGSASAVTVNGGMLDISSASYSQNAGLALGGALQVNGGAVNLGSISAAGSYTIFDLSAAGASASGWESWKDNLIVNGASLNRYAGASLSLTDNAAQLSFSSMATTNYSDMVWNGGEKGVWDQSSSNWDRTPSVADDNIMFLNGDSVSFNSTADITVDNGVTVNGLSIAEGTALTTHGAVTVTGTLSTGTNSSWTLASGTNQSLTEAQLKSITSSLVVAEGASLTMTNKTTGQNNTTTAFNKVSGAGDVVLNLAADNGIGVDTRNLTGDITVATGRLQVNACTFNAESTIRLASADSHLVFNTTDTDLKNNVEVKAANTNLYVNANKSGIISGVISGEGGLNKQANGTLTFKSQNTYKGATTISGGKIVLDTGAEYRLYNTISGGTLEVASGTTLVNNGHAVSSALTLAEGSTWKVSADSSGVYTLNTTLTGTGTIQVASGTTFKNNGKALLGKVNLDADGNWEVSGTSNNTYTLTKRVEGNGTMKLASGTTVVVDDNNNKVLASNVSICQNGTLRFNDAGGTGRYDMLDFDAPSRAISVAGGTLDFGGTRQTMGTWTLELSDGAKVTGDGGVYGSNRAAMDYNKASNNVIKATSGDSTISATTRLRGGSELTYDVAKDASLNVSGLVHADGGKNGGIVKTGAGTLHLNNANNDLDSVVVNGGVATIHGAAEYTLDTLKAAMEVSVGFYLGKTDDTSQTAQVQVQKSLILDSAANLNMSLTLAEGATLEMTGMEDSCAWLNGTLTLNGQVEMGSSLLQSVQSLAVGESLLLFAGQELTVQLGDTALTEARVQDYFSNSALATMENHYVTFRQVDNVGFMSVVYIPEPATTTLSLLALTALAARRRRKED